MRGTVAAGVELVAECHRDSQEFHCLNANQTHAFPCRDALNAGQRAAFERIVASCREGATRENFILLGEGGTGKSYVVSAIEEWMKATYGVPEFQDGDDGFFPTFVAKMAMWGKAAQGIGGRTVASALPARATTATTQRRFQHIRLDAAEEFSTMGCVSFQNLLSQLQVAHPSEAGDNVSELGLPVPLLLIGDILQFDPIGDSPLWTPLDALANKPNAALGATKYRSISNVFILEHSKRFNCLIYENIMKALRVGSLSPTRLQWLNDRCARSWDSDNYPDAVHIFGTNAPAREYNEQRLHSSPGRLVPTTPWHSTARGPIPRDQESRYLEKKIERGNRRQSNESWTKYTTATLKVGSRIRLTKNCTGDEGIAATWGYVNGATGTVVGFIFPPDGEPQLPACVVELDVWATDAPTWQGRRNTTVVAPVEASGGRGAGRFKRHYLPLILAWASTQS